MSLEFWQFPQFIGTATGFPASLTLADGNFMVVYAANGQDGTSFRIFDPFGETVESGNLFPDATDPIFATSLIADPDGGFTLLYIIAGSETRSLHIQSFDASRQPTGDPIVFATGVEFGTNRPAQFVELPDGGYAVSYNILQQNSNGYDVELLLIGADGSVGDTINIGGGGQGRQFDPRIASNGDNLFVTWWDDTDQAIYGRILGLDGTPVGNTFLVHSTTEGSYRDPQIAAFANGNYVVTFSAENAPGADSESGSARARLFDSNGAPLGEEFVLNEEAGGFQGVPNVTILPDDSFIVSYFGTGGGHRWFESDGTPRTDTLQSQLPLSQTSLVTLGDGRIAAFGVDSGLSFEIIDGRMGQLDGDEGDNILLSTREGDTTINGFGGNDNFFGNNDNDTFFGGEGNDTFRGKLGRDTFVGGPGDDTYYFTPFSLSGDNQTTIVEESGGGIDTLYNHGFLTLPDNVEIGILVEDAGTSELFGNALDNTLVGNSFDNTFDGNAGNDTIEGGSGQDVALYAGNFSSYDVREGAVGTFTVAGQDTDTVTGIEILRFDDIDVQLDQGFGLAIDPSSDDPDTFMVNIRDYDGNDLGAGAHWVRIGEADANLDGSADIVFVNRMNGRFAEVGVDENGLVQFDNHGQGGDTRVVGIYIDPLVQSGAVEQGGPFDSQQRFQNDLFIGNIAQVLGSQDYDGDGFAEIYFALTDGTAYLRALMHADGNIQYANYQSQEQVIEYLNSQGFGEETYGDWFPSSPPTGASGDSGDVSAASAMDARQLFYDRPELVQTEYFG